MLTLAEASQAPETKVFWSGPIERLMTSPVCPLNVTVGCPDSMSHSELREGRVQGREGEEGRGEEEGGREGRRGGRREEGGGKHGMEDTKHQELLQENCATWPRPT